MSTYEIIITCVALLNVALTITTLRAANRKAATARLDDLEAALREQLRQHEGALQKLVATAEAAVTHEHLADVYRDIKAIAQQVHVMVGQQQQMNENMRLLLRKMVHHE